MIRTAIILMLLATPAMGQGSPAAVSSFSGETCLKYNSRCNLVHADSCAQPAPNSEDANNMKKCSGIATGLGSTRTDDVVHEPARVCRTIDNSKLSGGLSICEAEDTWHLLTKSYGGTVSLIKGLTKEECEKMRGILKPQPCLPTLGITTQGNCVGREDNIETAECFQ